MTSKISAAKKQPAKKVGEICLWFFLCVALFPQSLHARCAAVSDPWFTIDISIDQSTLPEGVTFKANTDYPRYKMRYVIENVAETPLYLIFASDPQVRTVTFLDATDPITDLPFKIDLMRVYWIFRLQNEVNYYYETTYVNYETGLVRGRWATARPGTHLYSPAFFDVDYLGGLGVKTQQFARDGRPIDAMVPSPQPFSFTAYYGNQPIEIQGVLVYSLNNSYRPNAGKENLEKCLKGSRGFWFW